MPSHIQMLRDELHRGKENFDQALIAQPSLSREQRLARWELFLESMRPAAEKLSRLEKHAEALAARKLKNIREYGSVAVRA